MPFFRTQKKPVSCKRKIHERARCDKLCEIAKIYKSDDESSLQYAGAILDQEEQMLQYQEKG